MSLALGPGDHPRSSVPKVILEFEPKNLFVIKPTIVEKCVEFSLFCRKED